MDFFDLFLSYASDLEAPTLYNKCAALICTSSILSRRCWYPSGYSGFNPCLYVFLVGPIGIGKDQAARLAADQILTQVFKECLGADIMSKERLYQLMAKNQVAIEHNDEVISFSPYTIFSSELESITATQDDFFAALIELWDKGVFTHSTVKHATIEIERPAINFVANTNPASYGKFVETGKLGQGLARRCIFAYCTKRSQILTEYVDYDLPHKREQVLELRSKAHAFKKYIGKFKRSEAFYQAWDQDNQSYVRKFEKGSYANEHIAAYFNNRKTMAVKVSMIFCAIRETAHIKDIDDVENFEPAMTIELEDFMRADEFLKETETSLEALYEVAAKNPDKKYEAMVKKWLSDGDLTKQDICRRLGSELNILDVMRVLAGLQEKGEVEFESEEFVTLKRKKK